MSQSRSNKNSASNDRFVQQFFARIPPQTAATFNNTQLTALKEVYGDRLARRHTVDIRLSIPFFQRGFYFVLLLGKEKRSKERLLRENSRILNIIFLIVLITLLTAFFIGSFHFATNSLRFDNFPNKASTK